MRAALAASLLALSQQTATTPVRAAIVEAEALTTVTVEAPLFDENAVAATGGCNPAGCVGNKTRDGDTTATESRWSCKPALATDDSPCSISFNLADSLSMVGLNIAMYEGEDRTRTMGIYVDGALQTTWTSSGTTTDFENVALDVSGNVVELRGVLGDSEWLSVMEVEIMVDDGAGADGVEAGTVGTVNATADIFDTNLSSSNGCDPDGCTAALTRDGDKAPASRWSCSSALGDACSISYDLGAVRDLSELRLAMYKGDERQRTVKVSVDGVIITTWTSSGTTIEFESIDLSGNSGEMLTVTGVLTDMEWLSITETEIIVLPDGVAPPPTPTTTPAPASAPVATPTPAPTTATPAPASAPVATSTPAPVASAPQQLYAAEEVGDIGTVTTTATFFDDSLKADGGCDPSGCTAALTRDGDSSDSSRWSCAPKLGGDCIISYDLGEVYNLAQVRLDMYKGDERQRTLEVRVDDVLVTTWTSSGTTIATESILFTGQSGQVVELTGVLADSDWLSIVETAIYVWPDGVVPTPPSPTPTTTAPPVPPAGDLTTVGLLPLARGNGDDQLAFYAKDGDYSTSWTCVAGVLDCTLVIDLFYYRHIKQVKIALADGATRAVDMRISGRFRGNLAEAFVTSSGTTDGLETYNFDVFTNTILIQGVFTPGSQTISIAEVEFTEEVQAGEISVSDFDTPYGTGEGPTTDGFEFTSNSDDDIDRSVTFELASYAMVDTVEIKFPAGFVYKFDLVLYDDKVRGLSVMTITDLTSDGTAEWNSFDLSDYGQYLTEIDIVIRGTEGETPGFSMMDFRVLGTVVENPTDTIYVGSTFIEYWQTDRYPDFVALGSSDQTTIMEAICTVKKASFDGVDCVGGDDTATGTVVLPQGGWFIDGNIFMKSGVFLRGSFSEDDPYFTGIFLMEDAAGKTDVDAMVVMDGISDAKTQNIWIRALYDPDTSNDNDAVTGLGSVGLSAVGSTNLTLNDAEIRFIDGDAMVVRDSTMINIDAGEYEELYSPWSLASSRGTGLIVENSEDIWVRRHTLYENGVAGIHIIGTTNFTFDATIGEESTSGEGNVGTVDGQQPIEVIIEGSSLVTFNDLRVQSSNNPVMTVSADSQNVTFNNAGLSKVPDGNCVIQVEGEASTVTIDAAEDELSFEDGCHIKVDPDS